MNKYITKIQEDRLLLQYYNSWNYTAIKQWIKNKWIELKQMRFHLDIAQHISLRLEDIWISVRQVLSN